MRIFHIHSGSVQELAELPTQMPAQGFVWIACARPAFQARLAEIQASLQTLVGLQLVDLHVSDLLNAQLPSHYDYTSQYDLLVFRRLATAQSVGCTVSSSWSNTAKPTGLVSMRRSTGGPARLSGEAASPGCPASASGPPPCAVASRRNTSRSYWEV